MQTSVVHDEWLRKLIDIARMQMPTINGKPMPKNDFFVMAAGEKATNIIKNSPALNYDVIKEEFERAHGAVSEFESPDWEVVDSDETGEEDELLKELAEG